VRNRCFAFCLVSLFLVACGDSHEDVAEEGLDLMEELVELLEGVTDEESAKAAAIEIEGRFAEEGKALDARMEELKAADPAKAEEVEKEFKPQIDALMKKLMSMGPKLMKYPELQKAMSNLK